MQLEPVQRSIVQNQSLLLSIAADVMCFIARSIIAHIQHAARSRK